MRIQKPYITSKFRENIRICASLRPLTNPLSLNEWQEILETKRLTNAKLNNFDINENRWFKEGINWVIPTPVFETTTIQLKLQRFNCLVSTREWHQQINTDSVKAKLFIKQRK